MNYLQDREFLKRLDTYPFKEKYVRIIALDINENPVETLVGKATSGSINIDGNSKQQRSCSLSLNVLEEDAIITDEYWAYKRRFSVEIGLRNEIEPKYDDIIWFKQGVFLISSFTYSRQASSLSVSISGKDKLSLLDGTISGKIMAETKFDTIEEQGENGTWVLTKLPIITIIQQAVKNYGNEDIRNIIIKDLDVYGYELWQYIGQKPLYIFIDQDNKFFNLTISSDMQVYENGAQVALENIKQFYVLNPMFEDYNENASKVKLYATNDEEEYRVVRILHGDTAGYHQTDLTYPEDLILKPGETITSLLDKIVKMLGQYEYFYDLDGHFVFQKQKMYAENLSSPLTDEIQLEPTMVIPDYAYKFEDDNMFVSINTNPDISKVKNDFCVWGTLNSASGKKISIHARYAIDEKPISYHAQSWTSHTGKFYPSAFYHTSEYQGNRPDNSYEVDWREVLYRMAEDYYRHQNPNDELNSEFLLKLEELNPWATEGRTKYEQYYSDLQGFWRLLYNPEVCNQIYKGVSEELGEEYFTEGEYRYWNKNLINDPRSLIFWFDFLDTEGELKNFSVKEIGSRPFQESKEVSSLYNTATPELQFIRYDDPEYDTAANAYTDIPVPETYVSLFKISSQGSSCLDLIANNLSISTCMAEGLTITAIPIYYLQPNTRVYIEGKGDYFLSKISYSLTHNATMSLTLSKITKQFIKEVV